MGRGYANVNDDKGGETYRGISRVHHKNNFVFTKIDNLKNKGITAKKEIDKIMNADSEVQQAVKEFYKKEYWDKLKLDSVVYQDFACNIFLLGVNAGLKRAVKVAQESCNILADGIIGKDTMQIFRTAEYKETENFTTIEIKYYEGLVRNDETQRKFLNGWIKRAREV